ncbi:MAG: beta-propeller fold lactonase family protein [Phycisphaerae bacterium]
MRPNRSRREARSPALLAGLCLCLLAVESPAFGQAVSPAVFISNNGNLEGSVSSFTVNADGSLAFVMKFLTGQRANLNDPCPGCNAYEISLTPDGRYLATSHAASNDPMQQVTVLEVAADATLTPVGTFSVPSSPLDLQWITNTLLAVVKSAFGGSNLVRVYHFDPQVPALTLVDQTTTGDFTTFVAVHPSGSYLYTQDSLGAPFVVQAYAISPAGGLTLIDTEFTTSTFPLELAITNDGTKLYAAGGISNGGNKVLGFHIAMNGTLTPMAGSPFTSPGASPSNVFVSGDDAFLVVGHGTDATARTFAINPVTGQLTFTGATFDVGLQGTLGDVRIEGDLLFVTDNSTAVDGVTGVYSFTLNADGSLTQNGPLQDTTGIAPRSVATWVPGPFTGDLNCDGAVDTLDIGPFALALTDPAQYRVDFPNCNLRLSDTNGDGNFDGLDVQPFVQLLMGG